jgi:hypothetical protein
MSIAIEWCQHLERSAHVWGQDISMGLEKRVANFE